MKVKEESEKVGLKLNIQKTEITSSGPITSWQIDGNLLYGSGNSNRGSVSINLEGWEREGGGREVQKGGDICIPMTDSC